MTADEPTNDEIADLLDRIADLLEIQQNNPHRTAAYRNGAATLRSTGEPVAALVREGGSGRLTDLPYIGSGLARVIEEYVTTGRSRILNDLEGEVSPADLLAQVPGVGPTLARRAAEELGIESLEELERAAHDGRLATIEGFGPRRVETVRVSLAGMLSGAAQRRSQRLTDGETRPAADRGPGVGLLLDLDREYRKKAAAGELRTIAPRRFNPGGEAWLPIMHRRREGWEFTVLFSNTARAHELGKTDDWVVIYWKNGAEDQATVVTATRGELEGKRVVRGREAECREYYDSYNGT